MDRVALEDRGMMDDGRTCGSVQCVVGSNVM